MGRVEECEIYSGVHAPRRTCTCTCGFTFFFLNNPQRCFFNPTQRGILIDELSAVCQVCQETLPALLIN